MLLINLTWSQLLDEARTFFDKNLYLIIIQTKRGGELPLITQATKIEPEWVK